MAVPKQRIGVRFGKGVCVRLRDAATWQVVSEATFDNLLIDDAQAVLLQRWFANGGSDRTISQIEIGSGTTAPTTSDTGLTTAILAKAITTVDQTGESSIPPSREVAVTFSAGEANGAGTSYVREVGLLFDNDDLVTHALFKQAAISDVAEADPVVITSAGHGLSNGDQVVIESVGGTTELNGNHYKANNVATDTFELQTVLGVDVDGTGFTTYTSGGKWTLEFQKDSTKVLEVTYPVALSS